MGIYTVSNVLNAAIPFLLLPWLTRYLSEADYGILSNFNVLAKMMVPFVGINLMSAVQIQYLKEEVDNRNYVSSGMRLSVLLTVAFSLILFLTGGYLESAIEVPRQFTYLIGVYALFNIVIEMLLAIWRMEDKATYYGIFRVTRTSLEIGLVLLFVIGFGMNFEGSIQAMMIAYGVGFLVALFILYKKKLIFGTFNRKYLLHAMKYGIPLIPHTISGVIIMFSDKLILTYYHGVEANGVYSVGFMVGQMIGLLQNSFNQAWVPWVFKKLRNGNESDKRKMVKITYVYFALILLAVFVLWLLLPIIYSVFIGKSFQAGMDLVLWVGLGFAFNGMYKMVSVYIFYLERTSLIAYTSFGVAFVNIVLNFLFIPEMKAQGAATATLIAMALQFIVTWWLSASLMKMPWLLRKK
jgi:O-antigen/teichoic acid export membrane protein